MDILIDGVIWVLNAYTMMISACILLSWFPELQRNRVAEILSRLVDPILAPFRSIIPPIGNMDISALVVILLLRLAVEGLSRW
ncbi:MAG: YggT family protein [Defluviitaleaceae bacterium]|nr:YggT family protein [Defluviitaleaceae bacterium]